MRVCVRISVCAIRAFSVSSRAAISACSTRALAFDFHRLRFPILLDPRLRQDLLLQDAGALDRFARYDLGSLEGARALDLARRRFLLVDDARFPQRSLLQDAGSLDLLAGGDFLSLHRLRPGNLAPADFDIRRDPRLRNAALVRYARALDSFTRGDLSRFGLGLALGAFLRQQRALLGPAELDVAFLLETGLFARAVDLQRLLLRFEVAGTDLDRRILLDIVAQLAAGLDVLDENGETLGIEPVRRVEELEARLIDVENGDGFEFETVADRSTSTAWRTRST